jgi:hypothetical protein
MSFIINLRLILLINEFCYLLIEGPLWSQNFLHHFEWNDTT